MSRLRFLFMAFVILVTPVPGGAAPGTGASEPSYAGGDEVARVGDRKITLAELMTRFANLPPMAREHYANGGGLRAFLDDVVASAAIALEAQKNGAERDPLFPVLMAMKKEEVLRDLHARRTVLAQVDDAALRKRYESEKEARFRRPAAAFVRHILVTPVAAERPFSAETDATGDAAARQKAERLRNEIAAGADFAAVARRASEDITAAAGGSLGWVRAGQLVPEVEKVAFSAPRGQVSEVIASRLGYHLVTVEERLPAGLLPFETVRELLFQEMVGEQADALARAARQDRDEILKRHEVTTYPERLP